MTSLAGVTIDGDLTADVSEVLSFALAISVVRFSLSGIVNTKLKDLPCAFQLLSGGLTGQSRRKLHENLWYSSWHSIRYVYDLA